jgi:hypothetical protein
LLLLLLLQDRACGKEGNLFRDLLSLKLAKSLLSDPISLNGALFH